MNKLLDNMVPRLLPFEQLVETSMLGAAGPPGSFQAGVWALRRVIRAKRREAADHLHKAAKLEAEVRQLAELHSSLGACERCEGAGKVSETDVTARKVYTVQCADCAGSGRQKVTKEGNTE